MKKVVTVIDLGSNKIAAAVAAIGKNGSVSLLGLENLNSRGITGGEITDINKAVWDISSVMERLRRPRGRRAKNIFVTTKGADIKIVVSRGMIPLSRIPREITGRDVKRCLEIAAMSKIPLGRAVVEKMVRGFYIDGGAENIATPIGLYGMKLEAEAFIATANQSKIHNIEKCIDHAGFLLDGVYLSSTSSARSVLDGKEKEKGALLLDIGHSLTEGLVFKNHMLRSFRVIGKGTDSVLDERMRADKEKLNALLKEASLALPAEKNDFHSVVVTGGGALLDGAIEETERVFKTPARIGIAKSTNQTLSSQDAIVHTSTIGLINHIADEYRASHTYRNPLHKVFRKMLDIYESYF